MEIYLSFLLSMLLASCRDIDTELSVFMIDWLVMQLALPRIDPRLANDGDRLGAPFGDDEKQEKRRMIPPSNTNHPCRNGSQVKMPQYMEE